MKKAKSMAAYVRDRKGRRWYHLSVLAMLEEYGHGQRKDPEEVIREKARKLVARAQSKGWGGPPFDPVLLASFLKIKTNPAPPDFHVDALIFPVPGQQLEIQFNPSRPNTRRNFSICHEIAHTFFPDCYEHVRLRSRNKRQFDPDAEVERLCDIGASELLLPLDPFLKCVRRYGMTLRAIDPLRQLFESSRDATISRLVQTTDVECAAVFLEAKLKPSEQKLLRQEAFPFEIPIPQPKMRVSYSVPSPTFALFIPKDKSVPETSCVYEAVLEGRIAKRAEKWGLQDFPLSRIEAMPLPPKDLDESIPRAVALVIPL